MLGHNVSNKVQNWKAILDDGDDVISNPELEQEKNFSFRYISSFLRYTLLFFFMKGRVD